LDDEGYLPHDGRLKKMILRGEHLAARDRGGPARASGVGDAICFGGHDERYGERVGAAGTLVGIAGEPDLIDHCCDRLAALKVAEIIHVLDAIPGTATGNVQRKRVGASLSHPSR
jgi:acyl-CoA synthetase (AMP-forming)/AMP-acid ligase II